MKRKICDKKKITDVPWYCPGRKKAIAYSTIATRDWINGLMEDGWTIRELRNRLNDFILDADAEKVLDEYIKRGYGDWICNKREHCFEKNGG